MTIDIIPISSLRFAKVQYYSVCIDGSPLAEFQDFNARMYREEDNLRELREINRYIERIGQKFGAFPRHFKSEDAAEALPPPYYFFESDESDNYGLRLYCIRLSTTIVILLNGDRKTAQKVKDCTNCYPHFDFARKLAKKITQAILDGHLEIDDENKELIVDEDFEILL